MPRERGHTHRDTYQRVVQFHLCQMPRRANPEARGLRGKCGDVRALPETSEGSLPPPPASGGAVDRPPSAFLGLSPVTPVPASVITWLCSLCVSSKGTSPSGSLRSEPYFNSFHLQGLCFQIKPQSRALRGQDLSVSFLEDTRFNSRQRRDKMWPIRPLEYYSGLKGNETRIRATACKARKHGAK